MAMNPKNILNLLQRSFNCPEYNIISAMTDEERSFAHLESLIKDAINSQIFVEEFETLTYNEESVYPEAMVIEENSDCDLQLEDIVKDNKRIKVT